MSLGGGKFKWEPISVGDKYVTASSRKVTGDFLNL